MLIMTEMTEILPIGNTLAILVALVSITLSLISLYFARLRPGKLRIAPIRAYRVEPLNYHRGGESIRMFRLCVPMTLMNTGTYQRAITDLRIVILAGKDGRLPLRWELELPALDSDSHHHGSFAGQPTLQSYESTSHVYTFLSPPQLDAAALVQQIEESNGEVAYPARIEHRTATNIQ